MSLPTLPTRPIRRLLVANRGEIVSRVVRTARLLDIETVAVHSTADAQLPFVRDADRAVHLPGASAADTYLRADLLIDAARSTGCDAVHPGYGFLSENADFAAACLDAGLVFVGPTAETIAAMGDKVVAKGLMHDAGVPVLPGLTVDDPDHLDDDLLGRVGTEVGYPLLVKAAFGGGGRGMRRVDGAGDLAAAVASAAREAGAAFGRPTVFLERHVDTPRHVEVQILGDQHGEVVSLFERDCSVQRRYQKILEEAPSPAVDDDLRQQLSAAAITAARAIGYVGAGTVEFVLDPDGRFFFLEVNTRLQVEHPVTELVTGVDLVRLQLLVAEGCPLPDALRTARIEGAAIEARLYAEDVVAGFLPATGTVHRFAVPDLPGVRVDAGVADGSTVGVHYDSLLAKVIAHGPTRDDARRLLARALARTRVHGVTTNRELLVAILREPDFAAGTVDTSYLRRHRPEDLFGAVDDPSTRRWHAVAAALAAQAERRTDTPVLRTLPTGWRNVPNAAPYADYTVAGEPVHVTYRVTGERVQATVDGVALGEVALSSCSPRIVGLQVDGVLVEVEVHRVGRTAYVDSVLGSTELVEVERFPEPVRALAAGSLVAPMPGTVVTVAVGAGDPVTAGQSVVVLEAMKMEHAVVAPHDGTVVSVAAITGRTVEAGAVLAVVEPLEPVDIVEPGSS